MSISTNNNISTQQISNSNPSSESHSDEFAASVFLIVQDALTSSQSENQIAAKQAQPNFSSLGSQKNPPSDPLKDQDLIERRNELENIYSQLRQSGQIQGSLPPCSDIKSEIDALHKAIYGTTLNPQEVSPQQGTGKIITGVNTIVSPDQQNLSDALRVLLQVQLQNL